MQIIDAQIHVWGSGLPSNPSHWQVTSFTTDEAVRMMDEASVHGAVIHPPSRDPGADGMAFEAVKTYPARFAIMGALPLDAPNAPDRIKTWRQQPGLRITIDHLGGRGGLTTLKDHDAMEYTPTLVQLARLPNVAVKATGAPGIFQRGLSFSNHAELSQADLRCVRPGADVLGH